MKITVQVQVPHKYRVPGEPRVPKIQQGLYQISYSGPRDCNKWRICLRRWILQICLGPLKIYLLRALSLGKKCLLRDLMYWTTTTWSFLCLQILQHLMVRNLQLAQRSSQFRQVFFIQIALILKDFTQTSLDQMMYSKWLMRCCDIKQDGGTNIVKICKLLSVLVCKLLICYISYPFMEAFLPTILSQEIKNVLVMVSTTCKLTPQA